MAVEVRVERALAHIYNGCFARVLVVWSKVCSSISGTSFDDGVE